MPGGSFLSHLSMQSQFCSLEIFVVRDLRAERDAGAKTKEQTKWKGLSKFVRRFAPIEPAFVVRSLMKEMQ
jgi:hypothetical protein